MNIRNLKCPCGSGLKAKKCCMLKAWQQDHDRNERRRQSHEHFMREVAESEKTPQERRRMPPSSVLAMAGLLAMGAGPLHRED